MSANDVEEDDNFLDCFSFAMDGASLVGLKIFPITPLSLLFRSCLVTFLSSLTVVWTSMHDDMSKYAGAEFESALKEVQDNCIRKWEAINMFRYVLSSVNYSWAIKSHSLDLLLTLVDDKCSEETNDHVDFPCSTQIFAILKVSLHFLRGESVYSNILFQYYKYFPRPLKES